MRMGGRAKPAVLLLLASVLAGCGKQDDEPAKFDWQPTLSNPPVREVAVSGKPRPVPELADDDIVVAVNGKALTKRGVDVKLNRQRWFLSRQRNLDAKQKKAMYKAYGRGLIGSFVRLQTQVWAAREAGVLSADEIRRQVEKSAADTCRLYRLKADEYDKQVPGGLRALYDDLEDSLWAHTYLTNVVKVARVPEEAVSNILRQVAADNAAIDASNRVIRARLEAGLKRIAAGEDFGKVADELDENKHQEKDGTGFFGTVARGDVEDEELRDLLFSLDVGQVSGIVEEEDEYCVYKILDCHAAKYEKGKRVEPEKIDLARISVNCLPRVELALPEDPRADFERQDFARACAKLTKELVGKAQVVYPNGTNFWNVSTARSKKGKGK